jgi:hypothetical protein
MKKMTSLLALAALILAVGSAQAAENLVAIGDGVTVGSVTNSEDGGGCGALEINADGSYENGYAWFYAGCEPPYYGAFAECYFGVNRKVCNGVYDLTTVSGLPDHTWDAYLWDDAAGLPNNVVAVVVGLPKGTIAGWPNFTRRFVEFNDCVPEAYWAGYWGNWPGQLGAFYIGVDYNGFGGCPMTNVAPGAGEAFVGWGSVNDTGFGGFGFALAFGIGVETVDCDGVPTETTTWGAIKNLYN